MLKKQQVFAMYLANPNQKVLYNSKIISLIGVDMEGSIILPQFCKISDCQLILKPISEMSEEHYKEFCELLDYKETEDIEVLHEFVYKKDYEYCLMFKIEEIASITTFLIQNGYALSDEYFKLGYAIKERDAK